MIFQTCQWIESDPQDFIARHMDVPMCGKPTRPGSPYCDEHHARCYDSEKTERLNRRVKRRDGDVPALSSGAMAWGKRGGAS